MNPTGWSDSLENEFRHVPERYCDYNATTPMPHCLAQEMFRAFQSKWYNLSAPYELAHSLKANISSLRRNLRRLNSHEKSKIVFCASASEALNQAIYSLRRNLGPAGHLITTDMEHASVRVGANKIFAGRTTSIPSLPLLEDNFRQLERLLVQFPNSALMLQAANNETGAKLPLCKIRSHLGPTIPIIVDASQLFGKSDAFVEELRSADAFVLCPHKFYGPKGHGILSWSDHLGALTPLVYGGEQESGLRAGTENTPALSVLHSWFSLLPTLCLAHEGVSDFRRVFEAEIARTYSDMYVVAASKPRINNTSAICFKGLSAEGLIAVLDGNDIMASPGSACSSGAPTPSQSYLALGVPWNDARSVVRFSFGLANLRTSPEHLAQRVGRLALGMLGGS